jgi:hypothetical protein
MMTWGLVLVLPITFPRPRFFIVYLTCYNIWLTTFIVRNRDSLGKTKKEAQQVLI